jgi:hypothetical protein
MSDVLTIDEINRRYPDEWVLIGDPEKDDSGRVVRGEVLCHSRDREVVYGEAGQTQCTHIATHFAGDVPHDMVRIL